MPAVAMPVPGHSPVSSHDHPFLATRSEMPNMHGYLTVGSVKRFTRFLFQIPACHVFVSGSFYSLIAVLTVSCRCIILCSGFY